MWNLGRFSFPIFGIWDGSLFQFLKKWNLGRFSFPIFKKVLKKLEKYCKVYIIRGYGGGIYIKKGVFMPRIARINSQSNFHHIMVQGINKEYIFKDEFHIENYLNIIIKKLIDSNINILAYCIMNNHTHFLIYSEKNDYLSKFMQKVNTSYSQFYNHYNKRVGYVFRDRYLSQDILSQNQLYNCLKYIHNNPVKANIVKKMSEYKYSSYKEFFGKKQIITKEGIKLLLGSSNDYMELFNFIHTTFNENDFIDIKEKEIQEFSSEFKKKYNIEIQNLYKDKYLLQVFINDARKQTDVKINELGQILGISKSTVSNYIIKN